MGAEMILLVNIKYLKKMTKTRIMCYVATAKYYLVFKKTTFYPILSNGLSFRPTAVAQFTGVVNVEIYDDGFKNGCTQFLKVFITNDVPKDEEKIKETMIAGGWEESGMCRL